MSAARGNEHAAANDNVPVLGRRQHCRCLLELSAPHTLCLKKILVVYALWIESVRRFISVLQSSLFIKCSFSTLFS